MKPILFSTPMVRAILDGRKTMTRRVCKPLTLNYPKRAYKDETPYQWLARWHYDSPWHKDDILWVRETWFRDECDTDCVGREDENECPFNRVGNSCYGYKAQYTDPSVVAKWRPSIFMPREAARVFLRVINVRVERVQDITPLDAWNEGCRIGNSFPWDLHIPELQQQCRDIVFKNLWDDINAKRGYGWDTNPWVWVIEFKRVSNTAQDAQK